MTEVLAVGEVPDAGAALTPSVGLTPEDDPTAQRLARGTIGARISVG